VSFFERIKAVGMALVGKSLTMSELTSYFGRGYSSQRPSRSYSSVVAVFACVKARASAISSMSFTLSTGDDQVIESGPLVELIENPNPNHNRRAFWESTSSILDLFGCCMWVMDFDSIHRPVAVVAVSPLQMRADIDDKTGEIRGWKYRPAGVRGGYEIPLPVEAVHVIHDPDFENPDDPVSGLSPRKAVSLAISQYWKADLANESSLDNGLEPGGVFMMDGEPGDRQIDGLRRELRDRSGLANRRVPLILYGGMKWQSIGASFKDAEMVQLKRMSRTDICSAYNVPPSVVGFYENDNYAHADAADRMFWTNTIIPRSCRLAEEWDQAITSKWEGDRSLRTLEARVRQAAHVEFLSRGFKHAKRTATRRSAMLYSWFDSGAIPAIQRANLELAESAAKWNSIGIPLNSILQATDAPFAETPWGDKWFKPIGLEAVDADPYASINDPNGSEQETSLMSTDSEALLRRSDGSGSSVAADVLRGSEELRAGLWRQWRKSWAGLEGTVLKRLEKHFWVLRSQTLKRATELLPKVESSGAIKELPDVTKRDLVIRILFDLSAADKNLIASVSPLLRQAIRLGGEQSIEEGVDISQQAPTNVDVFQLESQGVVDAMLEREVRLSGVNDTLRRRVGQSIAQGIELKETVDEIAERIRGQFNFARTRASTIARTEVGAAVEQGRHLGREQAGIPLKSWLWSRKEQGRATHARAEVETLANPVPNGQPFHVAGHQCQHPRDSSLPPEESVNCACTTIGRFPNDNLKSVLASYASRGFLTYDKLQARDGSQPSRLGSSSPDRKDANHASVA